MGKQKKQGGGGSGARKHRRNYRWAGVEHSTTKYRQLHHLAPPTPKHKDEK